MKRILVNTDWKSENKMIEIRFTLIGDGRSDRALIPIVKWLLDDLFPEIPSSIAFADFRYVKAPPSKQNVKGQIEFAKEYYPYDILLYHRDGETTNIDIVKVRKGEILSQVNDEDKSNTVCIIPVKMMETWLLINAEALKRAAGNRNYTENLSIPNVNQLENIKAPKQLLQELLKQASGLKGRRLKKFNVHQSVHLLADNIIDYSPLRKLNSFLFFESELKQVLKKINQYPNKSA